MYQFLFSLTSQSPLIALTMISFGAGWGVWGWVAQTCAGLALFPRMIPVGVDREWEVLSTATSLWCVEWAGTFYTFLKHLYEAAGWNHPPIWMRYADDTRVYISILGDPSNHFTAFWQCPEVVKVWRGLGDFSWSLLRPSGFGYKELQDLEPQHL